MVKRPSPWVVVANIAMMVKGVDKNDMSTAFNLSRQHISSIINGRMLSTPARKRISDYLGIRDDYGESTIKDIARVVGMDDKQIGP